MLSRSAVPIPPSATIVPSVVVPSANVVLAPAAPAPPAAAPIAPPPAAVAPPPAAPPAFLRPPAALRLPFGDELLERAEQWIAELDADRVIPPIAPMRDPEVEAKQLNEGLQNLGRMIDFLDRNQRDIPPADQFNQIPVPEVVQQWERWLDGVVNQLDTSPVPVIAPHEQTTTTLIETMRQLLAQAEPAAIPPVAAFEPPHDKEEKLIGLMNQLLNAQPDTSIPLAPLPRTLTLDGEKRADVTLNDVIAMLDTIHEIPAIEPIEDKKAAFDTERILRQLLEEQDPGGSSSIPAIQPLRVDCVPRDQLEHWEKLLRSAIQHVSGTSSLMSRMYYEQTSDTAKVRELMESVYGRPEGELVSFETQMTNVVASIGNYEHFLDNKDLQLPEAPIFNPAATVMQSQTARLVSDFLVAFSPWQMIWVQDSGGYRLKFRTRSDNFPATKDLAQTTIKHIVNLPWILLQLVAAHRQTFNALQSKGFNLPAFSASYLDDFVPPDVSAGLNESRRDVQKAILSALQQLKGDLSELADYFGFLLYDIAATGYQEAVQTAPTDEKRISFINRFTDKIVATIGFAGRDNGKTVMTNKIASMSTDLLTEKSEHAKWKQQADEQNKIMRFFLDQLRVLFTRAQVDLMVDDGKEAKDANAVLATVLEATTRDKYKRDAQRLEQYQQRLSDYLTSAVANVRGDRAGLDVYRTRGIDLLNMISSMLPTPELRTQLNLFRLTDASGFNDAVGVLQGYLLRDSKELAVAINRGARINPPSSSSGRSGLTATEMEVWSASPTNMYDLVFRTQLLSLSKEDTEIIKNNKHLDKAVLFAFHAAGEINVSVVRLLSLAWFFRDKVETKSIGHDQPSSVFRDPTNIELNKAVPDLLANIDIEGARAQASDELALRIYSSAMYNAVRTTRELFLNTCRKQKLRPRREFSEFSFYQLVLSDDTTTGDSIFFSFAKLVAMQYALNQLRDQVTGFKDQDIGVNQRRPRTASRAPDGNQAYLQMVADYMVQARSFLDACLM